MFRIGLDVGGTKMVGIVTDGDGNIQQCLRRETPPERSAEKLMEAMASVVGELRDLIEGAPVDSVGVGIAGYVDQERGFVHFGPNLGIERLPLGDKFREITGLPVFVENDVNCALLGECAFGAAKGVSDAVGIFVGTGVGSAFKSGGRMVRGSRGVAAEAGHTIFIPGGRPCACGKRGCFEAYAGGRAIEMIVREAVRNNPSTLLSREPAPTLATVRRCMLAGDSSARKIWDEVVVALRVLVTNVIVLFDPKVVVLGGKLIESIPELFGDIQDFALNQGMRGLFYSVLVTTAALGDRAAALGATLLREERNG